ncbi:Uncharacterised protein [uncultured archaeon]|nr:Uncharacterised protein [uncultured archaeon]
MADPEYSISDGKALIDFAHKTIESYIKDEMVLEITDAPKKLKEKRGAFVTLKVKGELRGCIGHPLPVAPLIEAVRDLAISSATEDYRFSPITMDELGELQIEISILTVPEELKLKDRKEAPKHIKVGRDGLVIDLDYNKGLLLPQVAVEEGWNSKQFLEHTCWKASIPEDSWLDKEAKIFTFQSVIFAEDKKGKVRMTLPG